MSRLKPMGPRNLKVDAQRPTQHCLDCGAVFRRRPGNGELPCSHCGGEVSRCKPPRRVLVADYERHAIAISGATQEWTDERITAVLRAARNEDSNA